MAVKAGKSFQLLEENMPTMCKLCVRGGALLSSTCLIACGCYGDLSFVSANILANIFYRSEERRVGKRGCQSV